MSLSTFQILSTMSSIIKTKRSGTKHYFYRLVDFDMSKCQCIYVGSESLFDDFSKTLKDAHGFNESIACLLFEDGTRLDELVNEIELFIKGTVQDVKIILDIANMFQYEGVEECMRILKGIEEYLVFHSSVLYAFAPPVLSPFEKEKDDIKALHKLVNEMNVVRGLSPLFSFRWVMKSKGRELLHVYCNWSNDGSYLSEIGSHRYFKGILKYLDYSFTGPTRPHNLESMIIRNANPDHHSRQKSQVQSQSRPNFGMNTRNSGYRPVQSQNRSNFGMNTRNSGYRSQAFGPSTSSSWRNTGASGHSLHTVSSGRVQKREPEVDLRVKLATRKIAREVQMLERLESTRRVAIPNNVRNLMRNADFHNYYY